MNRQAMTTNGPRTAYLEMGPEEFRQSGHQLVDRIADFLAGLHERPVTRGESPIEVQALLGTEPIPEDGLPASSLIAEASDLLMDHSLLNGHPRFWGYITSSAAPIGALADLLAASVNPNVGGWGLSPIATEIESQTVHWIADLLGYPTNCGGLLVSGGNMANFTGFLAARRSKAPGDIRANGLASQRAKLCVYASKETHTWIEKAVDLFGLGTEAIRWIDTDTRQRIDTSVLRAQIVADRRNGDLPFLVVGTAGTVSTGAIDPLAQLAAIADEEDMWFHVDGAYGAFAAALPDAPEDLKALAQADSVAVDPHKWLYAPLEAGCILVRDPQELRDTFSFHPPYYHFDEEAKKAINYYEYGFQNSRGFRALKVWLGLRQAGRQGYIEMISDDIALAADLYRLAAEQPGLEALTNNLSITTFRYVPEDLLCRDDRIDDYLNQLNTALIERLQASGEAFVSNAVLDGVQALRACIVNFRTTRKDIEALPGIVTSFGRELDREMRPSRLATIS